MYTFPKRLGALTIGVFVAGFAARGLLKFSQHVYPQIQRDALNDIWNDSIALVIVLGLGCFLVSLLPKTSQTWKLRLMYGGGGILLMSLVEMLAGPESWCIPIFAGSMSIWLIVMWWQHNSKIAQLNEPPNPPHEAEIIPFHRSYH